MPIPLVLPLHATTTTTEEIPRLLGQSKEKATLLLAFDARHL